MSNGRFEECKLRVHGIRDKHYKYDKTIDLFLASAYLFEYANSLSDVDTEAAKKLLSEISEMLVELKKESDQTEGSTLLSKLITEGLSKTGLFSSTIQSNASPACNVGANGVRP